MKRVLVTGFEPFGGKTKNISEQALAGIDGLDQVQAVVLPVEFGKAAMTALAHIEHGNFDAVIATGEKPGLTPAVHFEERARNRAFAALIPDNAGQRTIGRIDKSAPPHLAATLDYTPLEHTLDTLDIRHRRSLKAGQFVCNEVLFQLLNEQRLGRIDPDLQIGFLHLSKLDDETAARAMRSVAETVRGQD